MVLTDPASRNQFAVNLVRGAVTVYRSLGSTDRRMKRCDEIRARRAMGGDTDAHWRTA
jgi:hypothetical protein